MVVREDATGVIDEEAELISLVGRGVREQPPDYVLDPESSEIDRHG